MEKLCRIIRHLGSGIQRNSDKRRSPLFEITRMLVRLDHIARFIVNPNRCIRPAVPQATEWQRI
jgi:hypothetical protein